MAEKKNSSKEKQPEKKKFRADKKFWVRLMCAFLAFLMVVSAAALIIQFLGYGMYAVETGDYHFIEDGEPLIAVGLMYADSVTVGFETTAKYGFSLGAVGEDRLFKKLYGTSLTDIAVICDGNLSKTSRTYSHCNENSAAAVGGWHIQITADTNNVSALFDSVQSKLPSFDCFPAYIKGKACVMAGCYSSYDRAASQLGTVTLLGYSASVYAPSDTALSVINPDNDDIIFEYDGGTESTLALAAADSGSNKGYIITPAKNTYSGIFKYTRYGSGVAVTNILPLEDYVKGVLPWEVSNQSSFNLLCTFAIAARSFALSMRKHQTFDVCNDTCCQVYKGLNRTNENVTNAVNATAGDVLTYNGEVACTTYSSSTGGCTISASEAWGVTDRYPYLKAVITPWENYNACNRGTWTVALSSEQILSRLEEAGYDGLSGKITDIKIDELADGSTYVWKLTITDSHGNKQSITRTDRIRAALGLYSANFVVGKAGDKVSVTDYSYSGEIAEAIEAIKEKQNIREDEKLPDYGVYYLAANSNAPELLVVAESVILANDEGAELNQTPNELCIMSDKGRYTIDITDQPLISDEIYEAAGNAENLPNLASSDSIVATTREVLCEGDKGTFVFIGRGWGHGVGLSQYGVRDLAAMGYDYKTILSLYLPGTEIRKFADLK